jgi:endonuclease III
LCRIGGGESERSPTVGLAAVPMRAGESALARTRRARRIVRELDDLYPHACCELDFAGPFQLLVATVLSAQTTDRRVNQVTPALFATYPDAETLAAADPEQVERIIAPTGFYRVKARTVVALAGDLVDRFDGQVPRRLEQLVTLPGVGRKTANVVLGEAFGVPGITVDTHVARLSGRLGLSDSTDPVAIERDLGALLARRDWTHASQLLIWHGRRRCHARRPACGACPLDRLCPAYGEGPTDPTQAARLVTTEGRR